MCMYSHQITHILMANLVKATEEEKKDAVDALAKYDMLAEDDSRKRFLCVCT